MKASPSGLVYDIVSWAVGPPKIICPQSILIQNRSIQVQRIMLTLRELPEYGLDPLARLGCRLAVKVRAGHDVQLLEQPLARGGQVIYYT